MRSLIITLISSIALTSNGYSQAASWLIKKFREADSVVLVSHEATAGFVMVDEETGKMLPLPRLLVNGKPNYAIVKERVLLRGAELDRFSQLLARPFKGREIERMSCFIPHHAVFIMRNGRTSYIDLCLTCQRFTASKDLERLSEFDPYKWEDLRQYFRKLGFQYEFSTDE